MSTLPLECIPVPTLHAVIVQFFISLMWLFICSPFRFATSYTINQYTSKYIQGSSAVYVPFLMANRIAIRGPCHRVPSNCGPQTNSSLSLLCRCVGIHIFKYERTKTAFEYCPLPKQIRQHLDCRRGILKPVLVML